MSGEVLSRRISELTGVALFGSALFWLIAIVTYDAADAVWFFKTGGQMPPANLAGRVGAFLAELSHQVVGFAALLVPVTFGVLGWHAFWCRPISAGYTKVVGLGLIFVCTAAFLSLTLGSPETGGRSFEAGGILGGVFATGLSNYFNHAGSFVVILTLLCLSIHPVHTGIARPWIHAHRPDRHGCRHQCQRSDPPLADGTSEGPEAPGGSEQASREDRCILRPDGDPGQERDGGGGTSRTGSGRSRRDDACRRVNWRYRAGGRNHASGSPGHQAGKEASAGR